MRLILGKILGFTLLALSFGFYMVSAWLLPAEAAILEANARICLNFGKYIIAICYIIHYAIKFGITVEDIKKRWIEISENW